MVYLDYNATTPLAPTARASMLPHLDGGFGNPSSIHAAGRRARAAIDDARDSLADLLGVRSHEIIFTGGGTEACNLAVIGLARAHTPRGKHVITSAIEHHAVLHAFDYLKTYEGFEVTLLPVNVEGRVNPDDLAAALRDDTTLVSVMHANNETGVLQPIEELVSICAKRGVLFHTDAVQTMGKIPLRPQELGVSALSLAAHKFYGPMGVGALYVGSGIALMPTVHGGAHENTRRPGTENVAGIAGMASAATWATSHASETAARLSPLREELWQGIQAQCPSAIRNGNPDHCLPNTLNISFPGSDGESLLMGLDLEGVCVSSGSACMVGSIQPSHVLLGMGLPRDTAMATVRYSLGFHSTPADIQHAISATQKVVSRQVVL